LSVCLSVCLISLALPVSAQADIITTIAGQGGVAGFAGDGGPATAAKFTYPRGIGKDSLGNIYIADTNNNRIRKIDTSGIISTFAGTGTAGFSGDGGSAAAAKLNNPFGVSVDRSGNVLIVDCGNHLIRKVNTSGIISTIAGTGTAGFSGDGGPATAAQLNTPSQIAFDSPGNIYIADAYNSSVRKINTAGIISTVAGIGTAGFSGDGGPATAAKFGYSLDGIAIDSADNIYIADTKNNRIRKVNASGIVTTVAGTGTIAYNGDGIAAASANLNNPYKIGFDSAGNLYISDYYNDRIRKIDTSGIITTFAGNGTLGYSGDGGDATAATIKYPGDIISDNNGNILFADVGNYIVRKVIISTRIINLSGSFAFGDVIVSKTKQQTLIIQNTGNSTLTVNSIAYPAGFNGSWNGTIPAGGSQSVTVTFSPTVVQAYTGTVTVNSDKTSGTNTIAISGNGIADPCQFTDTNGSTQQGIDLVKANPANYQLFNQTQLDQKIADAVKTEQLKWDANGDGKMGLEDIIRILQVLAGLRP